MLSRCHSTNRLWAPGRAHLPPSAAPPRTRAGSGGGAGKHPTSGHSGPAPCPRPSRRGGRSAARAEKPCRRRACSQPVAPPLRQCRGAARPPPLPARSPVLARVPVRAAAGGVAGSGVAREWWGEAGPGQERRGEATRPPRRREPGGGRGEAQRSLPLLFRALLPAERRGRVSCSCPWPAGPTGASAPSGAASRASHSWPAAAAWQPGGKQMAARRAREAGVAAGRGCPRPSAGSVAAPRRLWQVPAGRRRRPRGAWCPCLLGVCSSLPARPRVLSVCRWYCAIWGRRRPPRPRPWPLCRPAAAGSEWLWRSELCRFLSSRVLPALSEVSR